MSNTKPSARCSFCGKNQDDVKKLIAAPGVFICDECVDLCCEILTEESEGAFGWEKKPEPAAKAWPNPLPSERLRWGYSPTSDYMGVFNAPPSACFRSAPHDDGKPECPCNPCSFERDRT